MNSDAEAENNSRLENTVDVISAYLANNAVDVEELPDLISRVHGALTNLGKLVEKTPDAPVPVVPIKKSITPDYIICLEDGKRLKMLKRHLRTSYDMSPEQYRTRWGLPSDYPMVAPNYAKKRSQLAMEIGLGNSRKGKKS